MLAPSPRPLALSDSEIAHVMSAARVLAVADRDAFLQHVAAALPPRRVAKQFGDRAGDGAPVGGLGVEQPVRPDQEIQLRCADRDLVAGLAVAPALPKAAVTVIGRWIVAALKHQLSGKK